MKGLVASFVMVVLGTAVPAQAQRFDAKVEGARFDAAIVAGRAKAYGMTGPRIVAKSVTSRCQTHLISGKEDWTIDWTSASISDLTKGATLMVSMGPTQDFALDFADRAQLRIARSAGEHLAAACAG